MQTQKCFRCKEDKLEWRFPRDYPLCNQCVREDNAQHGREDEKKSQQLWGNICGRAGNRDGRHPTYEFVENRMTKSEFLFWVRKQLPLFRYLYPGKCPSVNRLGKDYELGRIELIPKGDNARQRAYCLSMWKARFIRMLYRTGAFTQAQLVCRFQTNPATVSRVINYVTHCG